MAPGGGPKGGKRRKTPDCDPDYEPELDETIDGELCATNNAKEACSSKKRHADMDPGGFKARDGLEEQNIHVASGGDGTDQGHGGNQVASGGDGDGIAQGHGDNQVASGVEGDGLAQGHGENQVGSGGDGIAQTHGDNLTACEDVGNAQLEEEPWIRGNNKGAALQRMSRSRHRKLPVVIKEGDIRPLQPIVAAKFATECNIIVRNHVPVFPKWKDYKNQSAIHKMFRMKVAAKFDIDTKAAHVKFACVEMMKKAVRQHRYHLKRIFFNPFPLHLGTKSSPTKSMTDTQWSELVKSWASEKKMRNSELNKTNRSKVKYHHTTGSRSYKVHLETLGDKYKDQELNAVDMFKECHYSKKKGYTPDVQLAIDEMENKLSEHAEDEEAPSMTEVVAGVLAEKTKKPTFLQTVGIPSKKEGTLKEQLAAEKLAKDDLKSQVQELAKKLQESEQARVAEQQDMARKQAETNAKLDLLLSKIGHH
uniref:Transposase Tnp1/En/Spm-like domain-containing protein n=1 Tax=Oryza punctata TaxID=4537 RepID=A0A0E0LTE8_ORYPU